MRSPGTYAVRGGIIDLYPINATQPCRLDFFGDELEEIRLLDAVTQRSGDALESLTLAASPRLSLAPSLTGLAPYLSPAARLVLIEPASLDATFSLLARENQSPAASLAPLLPVSPRSKPSPTSTRRPPFSTKRPCPWARRLGTPRALPITGATRPMISSPRTASPPRRPLVAISSTASQPGSVTVPPSP